MNNGKKSFVFLILLFLAPVLIGTLLFFNIERFSFDRGSTNYGTLVQPALPLEASIFEVNNVVIDVEQVITKKWTMLYFAPTKCNDFCKKRLALLKRVRLLTNEQMRRVRTTVIVGDKESIPKEIKKKYTNLVIASVKMNPLGFTRQFPKFDQYPIYLIDPLGNLMMYYSEKTPDIKKMLKDINRLLKYSRIG